MLLVRSSPATGALAAAAAIRARHPDLYVVTNEELVERFSRVEFSYFRQISTVLATITLFFGFLLIAVLLTVSVNHRLADVAALRAIGLSRSRVAAGVVWESSLLVGTGGLLAIPIGEALSVWLDAILRTLPGLPAHLHFFVFEPRLLILYLALLAVASVRPQSIPCESCRFCRSPPLFDGRVSPERSHRRSTERLEGVTDGCPAGRGPARSVVADRARRIHRGGRAVGLRQIHSAACPRHRRGPPPTARYCLTIARSGRCRTPIAAGYGCARSASSSSASFCCRC